MGAGARLAAAAVCLLMAVAASPAAAAPAEGGFHRIVPMRTPDPVLTDGRRWAAYIVAGHGTHVVDDRTGAAYEVKTPPGCELAAVGHGILMWQCYTRRGAYPVLFDMQQRRRLAVAGIGAMFDDFDRRADNGPGQEPAPYNIEIYHVGRHWVGGSYLIDYGYHSEVFGLLALNWRTGERRYDRPANAHVWPDFDSPGFGQRLCSPLKRVLDDSYDQRIFQEYDYERPYGVRGDFTRIVLERCRHPARVIARCRAFTGCADTFQLGSGMVTWATRRKAFLYDIRHDRRVVFSQRAFEERGPEDLGDAVLLPQHTRTSIFVSVPIEGTTPDGEYLQTRWRIYRRGL